MSTMITEVYDALKAAGAPEDKAREAAKALSHDITEMRQDIHLLKWITGTTLAITVAILVRLFIK